MKITELVIKLLNIYYYIYKYTCKINYKIYIGITKSPEVRFKKHKSKYQIKKSRLNLAILKYGIENFTIEIIDGHKNIDIAKKQETGWIGQYKDSGYELYNISRGGACYDEEVLERLSKSLRGRKLTQQQKDNIARNRIGKTHSVEAKKRISLAHIGKKMSEEAKKNMSIAKSTPEAKKRMSDIQTGKILSQETKDKISIAQTGKTLTEEHIQKLRNYMTGRKMNLSQESIDKIRKAHLGKTIPDDIKKYLSEINSGEKHPKSKLTNENAIEILKLHKDGNLNQTQIGNLFGVKQNTVNQIITGKRWKHIKRD
jgi:group I intron endonuclease